MNDAIIRELRARLVVAAQAKEISEGPGSIFAGLSARNEYRHAVSILDAVVAEHAPPTEAPEA